MRIQFAEPVNLKAVTGHTEFDAYGRRFSVDLLRNERLLQGLSASARSRLGATQLFRGKLEGQKDSWIRLTQLASGPEGAIWDGHDLYVVTTLARIQKNLTTPLNAAPGQPVVYRLSDALDGLPEGFCGLDELAEDAASPGASALKQYRGLVTQLTAAAATTTAEQLSLALIADSRFQQQNGSASADVMLARLNIVDGIFTEQIGVLLQPTELRLVPADDDPFTATDASQLLDQLSQFRSQTPEIRTAGLAHLITGKNLDGNTIGIAFRDTLCEPTVGVSLSDSELGQFSSALVMAHELGHNFGAEHDGVAGGACASTDSSYLMWPQFNGSATFSACSRNSMAQSIAQARGICILPALYADLEASAPATLDATVETVFTLPVTVRSIGNAAASGATLKLTLPSTLTFQGAELPDGACTASGSDITCQLGDIPADSELVVNLRLMSSQLLSTNLVTSVRASNDYLIGNGTTQTFLHFTSAIDLALAMTVSPKSLYVNDPLDITLDVSSLRSQVARGGKVYMTLSGLRYDSATAGAHTCGVDAFNNLVCNLADIPAGQTTRIVLHAHGERRGEGFVSANVYVPDDGDFSNNYAQDTVQITPENDFLISASADSMRFEPNTAQEVTYTLTAVGRVPTVAAQLRVWAPWNGQLDSVTSAGACTLQGSNTLILCNFGDQDPGAEFEVTVRFHTTSNGGSALQGEAMFDTGPNTVWINNAVTQIYSNLSIDAVARTLSAVAREGQVGRGLAGVDSVGLQPAQNVVATLDVPEQVQLTAFNVTNANNWNCTLLTAHRGRCTGAFATTGGASIFYEFLSDSPGQYSAKLTISADGDVNAANDISESLLEISPYLDVSVTAAETQLNILDGPGSVAHVTVNTGARPVPEVVVIAPSGTGFEIASMTASGAPCTIDQFTGNGRCELGNLPAQAAVPVTVTYRATFDGVSSSAYVIVNTPTDHARQNNSATISYTTLAYTDVRVQVTESNASAINGAKLTFPYIVVSNIGQKPSRATRLQIPLPDFTTVASVSATYGICTGVSTVICDLGTLAPGDTVTIGLSLSTSRTGNFTSNVTVQSANDSNGSNNSDAVQLSVNALQGGGGNSGGGASSGSSSKGGGGRFEWFALAFLGLLVVARARPRKLHRLYCRLMAARPLPLMSSPRRTYSTPLAEMDTLPE